MVSPARIGACDVTWKDAQGVALAGVLKNTGARYEGTATTRLASCGDLRDREPSR
jgi:hypothetical protein